MSEYNNEMATTPELDVTPAYSMDEGSTTPEDIPAPCESQTDNRTPEANPNGSAVAWIAGAAVTAGIGIGAFAHKVYGDVKEKLSKPAEDKDPKPKEKKPGLIARAKAKIVHKFGGKMPDEMDVSQSEKTE